MIMFTENWSTFNLVSPQFYIGGFGIRLAPNFTLGVYDAKGKGRLVSKPAFIIPGDDLLSPVRTTIGLTGLASEFGMGSGVSPPVYSPGNSLDLGLGPSSIPDSKFQISNLDLESVI